MRARLAGGLAATALLLAACGGGDDDQAAEPRQGAYQRTETTAGQASGGRAGADEQRVRAVIVEALTTTDPAACTRLLTRRAVEQFSFQRGRKALEQCREDADEVGARSVAVRRVEVDGARAEAEVAPKGGTLPLQVATFGLVKDGDRWKVDRLTAGTLDRPAFFREARKQFLEEGSQLSAADSDCIVEALQPRKDAELMRIFLDGDPRAIVVPTLVCAIGSQLPRTPAAAALGRCVTRAAERELTTGPLGRELARNADLAILQTQRFERVLRGIIDRCAARARPGSSAGGVS